jgi:hypothetical protein
MITRKNMGMGLILIDLLTNDLQKFETEIAKLKIRTRSGLPNHALYITDHTSI